MTGIIEASNNSIQSNKGVDYELILVLCTFKTSRWNLETALLTSFLAELSSKFRLQLFSTSLSLLTWCGK